MATQSDDILARLTTLLQDVFDDDSIVATRDLTADQVPGWDSLAHLRVMMTIERTFGVSFAASEITAPKNVGELAELIAAKTGA
jgi:acyl carrier protein